LIKKDSKYYYLLSLLLSLNVYCDAQKRYSIIPVRIPFSSSLNVTFGQGNNNIGTSLSAVSTGFNFTSGLCPAPGQYTIVNKTTCPSWLQPKFCNFQSDLKNPAYWDNIFFRPEDSSGYVMYVNNTGNSNPKIVFTDTVENLCGGNMYQFFASIMKAIPVTTICKGPDFTFNVRTVSGVQLQNYRTKDVDYSAKFILPAGETSCIVTIIVEPFPSVTPLVYCQSEFAIDDIQLLPYGPQPVITVSGYDISTWNVGSCFQATKPVVLNSTINTVYKNLFTDKSDTVNMFTNPAYQWQRSDDGGISWSDIPGATNTTFSQLFNVPDTFLIQLRVSEAASIGNENCSVLSNIIQVQIDGPPTNYTLKTNSPVCAGQDIKLAAEGAASYTWTGPNGFFDNVPYTTISSCSLKDSGMYYARLYSFGGCYAMDSIRVTVIGTDVHASPDTAVCKGNSVQLNASKGESYSWSPSKGLSSTTIVNPVARPDVSTVYTVTVTDKYGCSDTASTAIKLLNTKEVKAVISTNDYLCRSFDSVYFKTNSSGDIVKWLWTFGNGQTSIAATPPVQHYIVPAGRTGYLPKLVVTDSAGCTDSTVHLLTVVDNCFIAVPNAFTPNGDGKNDYLYAVNAYKAANLLFRVYNRFGQLIFVSRDRNKKWDGRVGGIEQGAGVYIWMLEYDVISGRKVSLKGTTVLIR
jgi:gliding motility-associated-like protein